MNLSDWQKAFITEARKGIQDSEFLNSLKAGHDVRMSIYARNLREVAIKALLLTYPRAIALVGEDFLRALAMEYIAQTPPAGGTLDAYGESLPDFVRTHKATTSVPYLADVMQLEWMFHLARLTEATPSLDLSALGAFPPEALGERLLALQPSARVLATIYPLFSIWKACADPAAAESLDLQKGREPVLVSAAKDGVLVMQLSVAEARFLREIQANHTLYDAFEAAATLDERFALEQIIQRVMMEGIVTGIA